MVQWELHDGRAQVGPLDEVHVCRMIGAGLPDATLVRPVGAAEWAGLRSHAPFAMALAQQRAAPGSAAPPSLRWVERVAKAGLGAGCVVQVLGFCAPWIGVAVAEGPGFVVGALLFVALILAGRQMARFWVCGGCGNRLEPSAVVCSACHARISGQ